MADKTWRSFCAIVAVIFVNSYNVGANVVDMMSGKSVEEVRLIWKFF